MPISSTHRPFDLATVGGVRLRTLVLVRWVGIAGQLATVFAVQFGFGVGLPLNALLSAIAASTVLNLALTLWKPVQRLNEGATAILLAWDIMQLVALLFFTGGLANPFALLLLAPVTVSATVLSRNFTIAFCGLTILAASALSVWSMPLHLGVTELALPGLYMLGMWTAIVVGSVFFAIYTGWIASETRRATSALAAAQAAQAREQRLAAVGAGAAATAHELSTPLGTIHLIANEVARELSPDDPLAEDIALLQREAERCRVILKGLSAKAEPEQSEGPLARLSPAALVETVVERYRRSEIKVSIDTRGAEVPALPRTPEVLHGLANVLQNAIQFARASVDVSIVASPDALDMEIRDDGPGFSSAILDHLGEPYVSTRTSEGSHMGLGIFIAINLLERSGASLNFSNRPEGGAIVRIRWPRGRLKPSGGETK